MRTTRSTSRSRSGTAEETASRVSRCTRTTRRSSSARRAGSRLSAAVPVPVARRGDAVDEPEVQRLVGCEEAIALEGVGDLVDRAVGVVRVDLLDPAAQLERFLRVDLDVARLALEPAARLVDEDARVGQCGALARRSAGEQ